MSRQPVDDYSCEQREHILRRRIHQQTQDVNWPRYAPLAQHKHTIGSTSLLRLTSEKTVDAAHVSSTSRAVKKLSRRKLKQNTSDKVVWGACSRGKVHTHDYR